MKNIFVIGGSNIDILSISNKNIIKNDSNPGTARISFGGVGRNIVENLSYLNIPVSFITAISKKDLGSKMIDDLLIKNIILYMPNDIDDNNSATYSAIFNNTGDMELAVCDDLINNNISIEYLNNIKDIIDDSSEYLVIDTNLNEDSIKYITDNFNKLIIVDAISTTKVNKLKDVLDKIYLLKVNEVEYEVIKDNKKLPKYILVSKGSKDAELIETKHDIHKFFKIEKVDKIINTNGCGDALLSGIIAALYNNHSLEDSIKFGIKCSKLTLLSNTSTNPNIHELVKEL